MPLSLPPLVPPHGKHGHALSYPDRAALVQLMGSPLLQLEALRLTAVPWQQGRRFHRVAARWLGQPLEVVEQVARKHTMRRSQWEGWGGRSKYVGGQGRARGRTNALPLIPC